MLLDLRLENQKPKPPFATTATEDICAFCKKESYFVMLASGFGHHASMPFLEMFVTTSIGYPSFFEQAGCTLPPPPPSRKIQLFCSFK